MQHISVKETSVKLNIPQNYINQICTNNIMSGADSGDIMCTLPKNSTNLSQKKLNIKLKPFVKWAGGKGQLLEHISKIYPQELGNSINKYAEPFVGGGAVLFDILTNYKLDKVYISDINVELINTYKCIKNYVYQLITVLNILQSEYIALDLDNRKLYYYEKRRLFNKVKLENNEINLEKAALFIFLNKTCFNGLYRVNKQGNFNVPMGKYKKPCICDAENLINVSQALKNVNIICGDYKKSLDFIDKNTLVYFDPPYRPLTKTAKFTSYNNNLFDDESQIELAKYVTMLNYKGTKIIVSNSDPKNVNTNDEFFDNLYKNQKIKRVQAKRMISCNRKTRRKINELLIINY